MASPSDGENAHAMSDTFDPVSAVLVAVPLWLNTAAVWPAGIVTASGTCDCAGVSPASTARSASSRLR